MCGIVGYVGRKKQAVEFVLDGLQALEYRGYDSAGLATLSAKGSPSLMKQVGRVEGLRRHVEENLPTETRIAIGHTRWATHGKPTSNNAHPQTNSLQTVFVVHNGIIENYQELRVHLVDNGYVFDSETDTEVIPHLIDYYLKKEDSFLKAFEKQLKILRERMPLRRYTPLSQTLYM